MKKSYSSKLIPFLYFIFFSLIILNFSIVCFSQVKTLTTLNLSENEKVFNLYTDQSQTNYAIVISSVIEGMVSTVTEYYVITPNSKIGPFERVIDVAFFDKGKQMLISVKKEGQYYVYKNNQISGPFSNIGRFFVIYSSTAYVYWVKENDSIFVIYMDKKLGPYSETSSFVVDQKTQKIVWTAKTDKSELFINGVSSAKADKVVIFGFYTEQRILCYVTGVSGSYSIVVGTKTYGPYENIGLDLAVKDENLASFFAKIEGKWYLIAGKEKTGPFDSTGHVAISPDGKKIAYAAYKESEGWGLYLGAKLLKYIGAPYFSYLDFVKIDATNYDIIYLTGNLNDEGGYTFSIFIGANDNPIHEYSFDSDYPYVGQLNLFYYGVDFMLEQEGYIGLLEYQDGQYNIVIYSLIDNIFGVFGPGEDYDSTFILDIAKNVIFFVLDGEFFIGIPSSTGIDLLPGYKTCGRIIYGFDGKKIGVIYYDTKTNTICYVDLNNVNSAISNIFSN